MADTKSYQGDELLTPGEAIRVAAISRSTLLRAERAGRITALRTPGGHRRYRKSDLLALLNPSAA
ncbi:MULTISPECIES: helix-turn-helix domain-containing protein [Rhodococcus]|uniref:helix-turn-helix domain-containing protein n=1 Tax=Rhodococcus TaxID=1827 RepID=UPI00058C4ECB